ncbi:LIC_10190 family membrane protein [Butyrivibrio sp. FCS014]|uniref:LIC_10190 family membrane protein n=1 Tax=Butyrivibrio sp. FCS014 TaxID=1408304 RepID=UPI00046566F0|nr:hypothetical protein [Butyrivibrio sp. FCS014]
MVVVVISWIYIAAICLSIGIAVNKALSKLIPVPGYKHIGYTGYIVTGLVTLTVYAETFSIFYKVGAVCHAIMLAVAIVTAFFNRDEIKAIVTSVIRKLRGNRLILFAAVIVAGAFFTSRGTFHTDTGIYHAQAIRLIEEYGVLKGLGNLQLHYAYNSSYLPLCALFTLSFILPFALHTMTGFLMVLFTIYAIDGLFDFTRHGKHGGDMARVAILIYAFGNMTGLQSPATDYSTMFMVLYIFCGWITYAEEVAVNSFDRREDIAYYGYLSVLAIFVVSMKLSAAMVVLLATLPFIALVKKKMWKELTFFLLIGFLSFLPYLVRNVILSGWLFYPVSAIDLFNFDWKIPAEYMKIDSDQIKVWGRCLFDVNKVDLSVSQWIGPWWENKQHYEEMLCYSQIVAIPLLILGVVGRIREKTTNPALPAFYMAILVNLVMWFMTAPFIRYGLAFMLLLPLCVMGDALDVIARKKNIVLAFLAALIAINFFSWIDRYFTDDLVFVKHYITDDYYLVPVEFPKSDMSTMDMNGQTIYIAGIDEVNSYHVYPGSCYGMMAERTELRGDSFEDGFKAK